MTQPGALCGVDIQSPEMGYLILTVYDSESSNVSNRKALSIFRSDSGMSGQNHEFFVPVAANRGLYAEASGTGTGFKYIVRYTL
jgi:hypothetical protein